ncbi:hypothetical protein ES705_04385 [subsurface metagenome]|nr:hypothetical protein [Clostridia bacterium]
MLNKPIKTLTIEDLENLIERKERENLHLEYKEKIGNSNNDKKEFLKDVSGFANGNGGFLIIGMKEEDGIPIEILGVNKKIGNQKIDEWINNVLLANLEKRIHYNIQIIDKDNSVVIILYIPESSKKPHMTTFANKNCYFIRHNTSVNVATHSEVRDMFEYSNKIKNKLEDFLKLRNLYNDNDENFGKNENVGKLFFRKYSQDELSKKPVILFSFIPTYLDDNRINTVSEDLQIWLEKNSKGFEPNPRLNFIYLKNKIVNLYGIILPEIYYDHNDNKEYYKYFFEMQNNSFFENGSSDNFFHIYPSNKKVVLHLTWTVGYAWILINFAKSFYTKINYLDEFTFQISLINVKDCVLGGFDEQWHEPFSLYFDNPPFCMHEKFKIIERLLVSEMSDEYTKKVMFNIAFNLSRAFGVSKVKCFDEQGNFNKEKMEHFTM